MIDLLDRYKTNEIDGRHDGMTSVAAPVFLLLVGERWVVLYGRIMELSRLAVRDGYGGAINVLVDVWSLDLSLSSQLAPAGTCIGLWIQWKTKVNCAQS